MSYVARDPEAFSLDLPRKGGQVKNAKHLAFIRPRGPLFVDLTGKRFGSVTVTAYAGKSGRNSSWFYRCDCGSEGQTKSTNLKRQKSCGCEHRSSLSDRQTSHGATRGKQVSPEFRSWESMIRRCCDPRVAHYPRYGGRGISVCEKWREGFANFYADMGRRPSPKHSLDRIDNDGNYEPGNCRWATWSEQRRNRPDCHWVDWDGEVITLQDACDRVGLIDVTVHGRLRRGWSLQRALSTPTRGALDPSPLTMATIVPGNDPAKAAKSRGLA